jgi:hypothetical protein
VIQSIAVQEVLRQAGSGSYADLVTRHTGRTVRVSIEQLLDGAGDTTVARIDFSGVGLIDFSCADEIVANLLRQRPIVLLLRGLADGHRDALEPVLLAAGRAALWERPDGTLDPIGPADTAQAIIDELLQGGMAVRTAGGGLALSAA